MEQDEPKVQNKSEETMMAERKDNQINLNINLSLNGGNLQVRIPNRSNEMENEENVSIHIGPVSANFQTMGKFPISNFFERRIFVVGFGPK